MDFKHIFKTLSVLAIAFLSFACKKNNDDTKLYMDNNPVFSVERYLNVGDKVILTPTKVTVSKDASVEVGYAWTITSLKAKADTSVFDDGHFEYTFSKDTMGTFTVSCSAFARNSTDYYSATSTAYVTIVKPGLFGGSISGIVESPDMQLVTDDRAEQPDGDQEYHAIPVNGKLWMAENLAYTTADSSFGTPYAGCEAMNHVFGRFYNWEEAQTACPSGWHLSTEDEWLAAASGFTSETLELTKDWAGVSGRFMVYAKFNGSDMWEWWPQVNADNKSSLCVIPAGWCYLSDKSFNGINKTAAFWTSSESDGKGVYRYMMEDQSDIFRGVSDKKSFGASVRCVQD